MVVGVCEGGLLEEGVTGAKLVEQRVTGGWRKELLKEESSGAKSYWRKESLVKRLMEEIMLEEFVTGGRS